ncbi:MAG: GAF domain-containing protein [Cyanothece sp. SIO1E1]|nr:GAF domain-containing protein [Cyanothece sp. SIO1E1]
MTQTGVADSAETISLDLTAIMQAAQALAGEIELEQLLSTLMQVLMKHGGAEKGILIIPKAESLAIAAMGMINQESAGIEVKLLLSLPIDQSQLTPISLINYVARTQTPLVLDDATQLNAENEAADVMNALPTPAFHQDSYVIKYQPKSVLCLPLNHQGKLIGILYLENNLTTAAFTTKHLEILQLLTAQAAISLENARLYEREKQQRQELALKNAALEQAKQVAEAASHAKSTFLAKMSHELRTPLNAILGFGQLLHRDPTVRPEQKAHLSIINRSGEHLLTLINDVLQVTRIEAGKTTLNFKEFNLYQLLGFLQEMFNLQAQSKGLELIFDHSIEVPQYVQTDEIKLRQILMNLLGNAIKFTETGYIALNVRCPTPYTLCFEVKDTGPGIAPDELETIFEAFVQTETGRRSQEGIGLGLPISRKFAQLMGGDLTVSSQLGRGTTFAFEISIEAGATIEPDRLPSQLNIDMVNGQPNTCLITTAITEPAQPNVMEVLAATDLQQQISQLSVDWLAQLYQAATQLDENKMLNLIEQLDQEHSAIAQALVDLVEHFRFEKIAELTQSARN